MRTYVIYLLDRIGMFDPPTDLLIEGGHFLTWREPDQLAPPGFPLALARLNQEWLVFNIEVLRIVPVSPEDARKWLHHQLGGRKSLGPHSRSDYFGLFATLGDRGSLLTSLTTYNALVAESEEAIVTPVRTHEGLGYFDYASDGQVTRYGVEAGSFESDMWDNEFRFKLLEHYKQIQDKHLGITS